MITITQNKSRFLTGERRTSFIRASIYPALIFAALSLSACGVLSTATPAQPTASATPIDTASIEGFVWDDLCLNQSKDPETTVGCLEDKALGIFVANGVYESGEARMSDVTIELGLGPCPATAFLTAATNAEGRYAFESLAPGTYCVSASIDENATTALIESGLWTYPLSQAGAARGMHNLTLLPGERRQNVNFGWDRLDEPALPTTEPTSTPSPSPSCSDSASFIKDVSVPDDTYIKPGVTFTKTWRLHNSGSCTWTRAYHLIFVSGYRMGGDSMLPLRGAVEPGQTVDVSIELRAPNSSGTYWGYWMLRNAGGEVFGVGDAGKAPFWVKIRTDPEISEWRGEYFDNQRLEGDPDLIRNDKKIDFNWKYNAPDSSLPSNEFSARWTRTLNFKSGTYRFTVRMDDGARLWVDDRLVIDEWQPGPVRTEQVDLQMTPGKHTLKLEYYERKGVARVHFEIDKVSINYPDSWTATYWFNRTMDSKWALVESAAKIEFDWGSKAPALGLPKDNFSAAWRRTVEFEPGIYRLNARADDGIRVKIDGDVVLDEWHTNDAGETYSVEISLAGSSRVEVEYFERSGKAEVSFWWDFIRPLNRSPVAMPDAYETAVNEVLIVSAPGVLDNDQDADGDMLTARLVSDASHGDVTLDQDGSFVYLPDADFTGDDTFTYEISDGQATSAVTSVTLTVSPINLAPLAQDDVYETPEDQILIVEAPGILDNDYDPEGKPLQIVLEDQPVFGSLLLNQDGSLEYSPLSDFHGDDSFSYRVSDGERTSELASVLISIQPVNDTPQAIEDVLFFRPDQVQEIDVLANDLGLGDGPLTISIEITPSSGSIEVQDGKIIYTPNTGFSGDDSFTYVVTDHDGERSQANVIMRIDPLAP